MSEAPDGVVAGANESVGTVTNVRRVAVLLAVIMAAGACVPPNQAGGPHSDPTCASTGRWAVGDSFTKGFGRVAGWPDQDPPITPGTFANKGVGGMTIAWLRIQTEMDLGACEAEGLDLPEQLVFQAGANDLANFHLTVTEMQEQFRMLVDVLDAVDVDYRVISISPIPAGADWVIFNPSRVAFNSWLATTYPSHYVNCDDNLRRGTWLDPSYAFGDRIHLNRSGASVLAACVLDES